MLDYISISFRCITTQTSERLEKRLFINYSKAVRVLVRPNDMTDHLNDL